MDSMPEDQQESGVLADRILLTEACPPETESSVPGDVPPVRVRRGVAPIWHTVLLVLAILGYSVWGAVGASSGRGSSLTPVDRAAQATAGSSTGLAAGTDRVRMIRYGLTGLLEIAIVGWVAWGLWLRRVPFRSLLGAWPRGLNETTLEVGIAALFWICSMIVLVTLAVGWSLVQTQIYQRQMASHRAETGFGAGSGSGAGSKAGSQARGAVPKSPQEQQAEMARQLMELAPANGLEIAAWGALCLVVGFSEELIFRGYLQAQSIGVLGNISLSVAVTAVIFGAAHGYQGLRGMVLISVYGALFGILALLRRNLFPGMLAHSWHDFATGMALALIRSTHLLDHLPSAAK